jgi:hypothetical protein
VHVVPIAFHREEDVVHTIAVGVVTESELMEHAERLAGEFGREPFRAELADLSQVRQLLLDAEALARVAEVWRGAEVPAVRAQVAFVAPSREAFGLASTYEILRGSGWVDVRVFRDDYAARQWLDLPEK